MDEKNQTVYLTGIDKAHFRKPVRPGDTVEYRVTFSGKRMGLILGQGEVYVGDTKGADARLTGARNPEAG